LTGQEDILARLTRLEDIEAIKQLKALYSDICDDDHNPDRIGSVMAEDGVWEAIMLQESWTGDPHYLVQGHAALREVFEGFRTLFTFSQHNMMNPIITVDGDHATGKWNFLGTFTVRETGEARWSACRYNDKYVKINGEWKHSHLFCEIRFMSPYETGWGTPQNVT
jgi:hypothetical protein